ncbi:MAG: DUF3995 domain-containing protein [Actinomycetota bacterium]|jgi:hypothetical protein|nr:DUF3995 domain-containing protein [Actinomycetota bacterium]
MWAVVFAIRGAYWATGGTVGLGTLSQGIRNAAAAGDPTLYAALWITVVLEVAGVVVALALARGAQPQLTRVALTLAGTGAGTMLVAHGALFVGFGLVAVLNGQPVSSELRWYALLWEPWFLLGAALFLLAVRSFAEGGLRDPGITLGRTAGVLGGLATAAAPFVVSALAGS